MRKAKYQSFLYIYWRFLGVILVILIMGICVIFYQLVIVKPNGKLALSNWPRQFGQHFKQYINMEACIVTKEGLSLLEGEQCWLQILDDQGKECYSYDKPIDIGAQYSPITLIKLGQEERIGYTTVYIDTIQNGETSFIYIVGIPTQIAKVSMYLRGSNAFIGKHIALGLVAISLVSIIVCGICYSYSLTWHMKQLEESARRIANRTYQSVKGRGIYKLFYRTLDELAEEIYKGDELATKQVKLQEEWIANITHDLKTPLSLVKGYAELTVQESKELELGNLNDYGLIVLKNATYIEELVNDLKLTYQLKNGIIPLKKEKHNLARFVKEIIIDILNEPKYNDVSIVFETFSKEVMYTFDALFLKRALINLIVNAIVHNRIDTSIEVRIEKEVSAGDKKLMIKIQDDGSGMTEEEVAQLFIRYYRGNSMQQKETGTGLGMAIAKQIIELHQGMIKVESRVHVGTTIAIYLPYIT